MKPRHLRLVRATDAARDAAREPTPAERIRQAARRLGAIGREMAADAEALRGVAAMFAQEPAVVKEAS